MKISDKETPELLEFLKSVWVFETETGVFKWAPRRPDTLKNRQWNGRFAGKVVGGITKDGYLRTTIEYSGKALSILLHRVAWAFSRGSWPVSIIDHRNENKSDNRADNLRIASYAQNIANRVQINSTGVKGVRYDKRTGKFQARIMVTGKSIHLGMFDCAVEAGNAYDDAAKEYYKDFAKTNQEADVCR